MTKTTWRDYLDPATWHPAAKALPLIPPDDLEALARDIEQAGRVHDPIIVQVGLLLDGRNRVLALAWLDDHGVDTRRIKVTVQPPPSGQDAIAFVVSANLARRHLDPSQRAMAAARLRALSKNGQHSIRSAAQVYGARKSLVAMADKVLAADPKLAEQVLEGEITIHRAVQEISRREAERAALERAATIKADSGFHKGDARKWIVHRKKGLPNDSVKLLLTDPPYGMGHKSGIEADEDRTRAADLLEEVLEMLQPKLRDQAVCAIFCEWDDVALQGVVAKFFDVHGRVRWVKTSGGAGGEFFIYDSEDIIIGTKKVGDRPTPMPPTFFKPLGGTIGWPPPLPADRIHPTEKPLFLLYRLLWALTVPGDLVADPFAGSGSALLAAKQLGRQYWGAELNKVKGREQDWYPRGLERLHSARPEPVSPREMFRELADLTREVVEGLEQPPPELPATRELLGLLDRIASSPETPSARRRPPTRRKAS